MLDIVILLICSIVWFERLTVITHSLRSMLAETRVSIANYHSVLRSPVCIDWIFPDIIQWYFRWVGNCGGGSWRTRCSIGRGVCDLCRIIYEQEVSMPDYCQSCLKDGIISTDSMPRLPRFRPTSDEILVSLRGGWSEIVTVSGSASGAVPIIYETLRKTRGCIFDAKTDLFQQFGDIICRGQLKAKVAILGSDSNQLDRNRE